MKNLKKIIILILSACCFALCVAALAACDNSAENYYSVTLQFDSSQGTLSKTEPSSDLGYKKDEQVTITVTPNQGYAVEEVKVNGAAVELTEQNTYAFAVTEDTVVEAFFALGESDPFIGNWKSVSGDFKFSITSSGATVTAQNISAPAQSVEKLSTTVNITAEDGTVYSLSWYQGFVSDKILVMTVNSQQIFIVPDMPLYVNQSFNGDWYNYMGTDKLSVDLSSGTASFNGSPFAAIVYCGYVATAQNNDGSTVAIDHDCYYLIDSEGGICFLGWYKYTPGASEVLTRAFDNPTITYEKFELTHRSFINEIYIDPHLDGIWRDASESEATKIEVDREQKTVKIGGQAVEVYNNGGAEYAGNLVYDGTKYYTLEVDPGYNYYLTKEEKTGSADMGERTYYLNAEKPFGTIENSALLNTQWDNLEGQAQLQIDESGSVSVKIYRGERWKIFVCETLDNGVYKIIAISATNKKIEMDYDQTRPDEIKFSDGYTQVTYYKNEEASSVVGFMGVMTKTYHSEEGKAVRVEADRMIFRLDTFDLFDDEDFIVTQDNITETVPQYGGEHAFTFTFESATYEHTVTVTVETNGNVPAYLADQYPGQDKFAILVTIGQADYLFF